MSSCNGLAVFLREEGKVIIYWQLKIWGGPSKAGSLLGLGKDHNRIGRNNKMRILRQEIQRRSGALVVCWCCFPLKTWEDPFGSSLINNQSTCLNRKTSGKIVLLRKAALPPPQFVLRSNNREGTQPRPSTENWGKDLLSMALPIRTRPSFPLSQSLPSGSFHKPLIFLHQRADGLKTTITKN